MNEPLRATYRWTEGDYNALCDAFMRLTPARRRSPVVHVIINVLFAAAAAYLFWSGEWIMGSYFALTVAALLTLEYIAKPWLRRRQFKRQYLGEHEITMTADDSGLATSSALGDSRQLWTAIRHVDDTDAHVILWPNDRIGYLVPKRAFKSAEQAEQFATLAKEKTRGQTF